MYLNGSGEYATTPAVDFGISSFTIASWVKMLSPVSDPSPLFSDWHGDVKFLFYALHTAKWAFSVLITSGNTILNCQQGKD